MNLVLHQFKTDLRHFRARLLALWCLFALDPILLNLDVMASEAAGTLAFFVLLGQACVAVALIASLVQADALVGTEAAWLTRPLRRNHLFWAKTAFIVLGVILPRLAVQMIGWVARGYSSHLLLCAVGESLLFTVPFVLLVATLAALTRDLGRFFLAVGIAVGGMFAWVVIVEMLRRGGLLDEPSVAWQDRDTRYSSAVVVAFLCVLVGAGAAWVAQAYARRWRCGVAGLAVGLMAFPVIITVWGENFLRPQTKPSVPLTLVVVSPETRVSDPQSQRLSAELVLQGVPAHHVAVAQRLSADVLFAGDRSPTTLRNDSYREINPFEDTSRMGGYLDAIETFFPTNTLWFRADFGRWLGSVLNSEAVYKRFTNSPPPGTLKGSSEVDLYAVTKVAELPIRPGASATLPGRQATLRNVRLTEGVISLTIAESVARWILDRDWNTAPIAGRYSSRSSRFTYVLYHPGSGEAYVIRDQDRHGFFPTLLGGESRSRQYLHFPYPALRERLAGVTAADWLREARLCVFAPVYAGSSRLAFHKENFVLSMSGNSVRDQKTKTEAAETIASAALPANPTPAQTEAYVDTLLDCAPEYLNQPLQDALRKKLAAIGTNGLPALLRRLPLPENLEDSAVLHVVEQLATREHLDELRSALGRDDRVIRVFVNKRWEADARDVLLARLPDHRRPMIADALRVAAEARDPKTYANLRWHFVRLDWGHDRVLAALEQCPGFDTAAATREAWERVRLGLSNDDTLAPAAAKLGLPEALHRAVIDLENTQDKPRREREVPQLAALTGYTGPSDKALAWLGANLARFRFDETRQHYILHATR